MCHSWPNVKRQIRDEVATPAVVSAIALKLTGWSDEVVMCEPMDGETRQFQVIWHADGIHM